MTEQTVCASFSGLHSVPTSLCRHAGCTWAVPSRSDTCFADSPTYEAYQPHAMSQANNTATEASPQGLPILSWRLTRIRPPARPHEVCLDQEWAREWREPKSVTSARSRPSRPERPPRLSHRMVSKLAV